MYNVEIISYLDLTRAALDLTSDLRLGIDLNLWLPRQLRFLYCELLQHDVKVCV